MTLKNSSNKKKNPSGNLKQYHWLALMCFAVYFLCFTLPILMQAMELLQGDGDSGIVTYFFTSSDTLLIPTFFLAFVTAIALFKYLNNKAEVDFFHSLPVKAEAIFLHRFSFGIVTFLLPFLLNYLCSYFVAWGTVFTDLPTFSEILGEALEISLFYSSVYAFACLGTIVTGNTFMAVCSGFGFSLAPTALCFVFYGLCEEFLDFFARGGAQIATTARWTTPFYMVLERGEQEQVYGYLILQALVMTALSFVFFLKRPSENAGNPVAVKPFHFIIKGLGVLCGGSLGGVIFMLTLRANLFHYLLGAFILALILHIAFEMLFEMDIRAGLRNKKHFLLLYGILFVTATVIYFDMTGYDRRQEPLDKISSITWQGVTVESPENVAILHEMISDVVTAERNDEDKVSVGSDVTVKLNNGTSYQREYSNAFLSQEDYLSLVTSTEYLLKSHNYNLTEEELTEMERQMARDDFDQNTISVSYHYNYSGVLSYRTFRVIYDSVLAEIDQLTPEFLAENTPVLCLAYYDHNNYSATKYFPLYHIHTEALEILKPPDPVESAARVDGHRDNFHLQVGSERLRFVELEEAHQKAFLAEMIPVYDYHAQSSAQYTWHNKDLVTLTQYGTLLGYLSPENYEAMMEDLT
ncbi:MAG: hypothetical protein R3Y63_07625 [Eubacteriales bacterium]